MIVATAGTFGEDGTLVSKLGKLLVTLLFTANLALYRCAGGETTRADSHSAKSKSANDRPNVPR